MSAAYLVVTVVSILVNVWAAVADLAQAKFVLANMNKVGVPQSRLPVLGTLKLAGAAGLLLGLRGIQFIGVAAATGLVLFFTGALVTAYSGPGVLQPGLPRRVLAGDGQPCTGRHAVNRNADRRAVQ